ncbi:Undecaprenyl-diphosphatase [Cnuella takakiae]|uniref:Undecaprenyl-diphosphatase n=1 Tax=Cnuella takakiae TaxID=1302690 RepID=A0A1M5DBA2_9BACT|nr:undecaprenyl-diphosphate phosphatase [Cnuella takakiae]OLY94036.1 UDP-diphosphatase [Cnuella takakiae]SHF64216.1 Undecaprenyl-diphosphatase [Cnuella takakiae]
MSILEAVIVAIIEGLTEFLPVSSTGHMIIASSLLGVAENDFTKVFEVSIQLGAILAVVLVYWRKFFQFNNPIFYAKLIAGVVPALLAGLFFNDAIEALLGSELVVAIALLLGGFILLYIDRLFPQPVHSDLLATETTRSELIEADEQLTFKKAFVVGCWQLLAMIPGVSRSASSIIGGMQQKLSRNFAAEFSFFLAVPTMVAATGYSLFLKDWGTEEAKGFELILASQQNIIAFVVGNMVAFVVALLAIRFFISYLKKYGFRIFGIYRIIVGTILIVLYWMGLLG